jgi:hypothetical protein
MFKEAIFSLHLRGKIRGSTALLSQRAYTERPISPLIEEKTPLPSSDKRRHKDTEAGRRSR